MNNTASSSRSSRSVRSSGVFLRRFGLVAVAAASAIGCHFPPAEVGRSMGDLSAQTREGVDFLPRPLDASPGTFTLAPGTAGQTPCRTIRILGVCVGAPRPASAPPATSSAPSSVSARPWSGGL